MPALRLALVVSLLSVLPCGWAQTTSVHVEHLGTAAQVVDPQFAALDFRIELWPGRSWLAMGAFAEATRGAELVYAADPNGRPVLTVPDADGAPLLDSERFVTFVSRPREQNAARRFRSNGEPELIGSANGGPAVFTPQQLDVLFAPPFGQADTEGGYVVRMVVRVPDDLPFGMDGIYAQAGTQPLHPTDTRLVAGQVQLNDSAAVVATVAFGLYAPSDCNGNGLPDNTEAIDGDPALQDCNENGIPDGCDLAAETSQDQNANQVPDECEDCNGNGIPDDFDIAAGADDCDGNGLPDECDPDCNQNGQPDACDLFECDPNDPLCQDCDGNGALDHCETRLAVSRTSGRHALGGSSLPFVIHDLPRAVGPVQFTCIGKARLDGEIRFVEFRHEALLMPYALFFVENGLNCEESIESVSGTASALNDYMDEESRLELRTFLRGNGSGVCDELYIELQVDYQTPVNDCNRNGIPDDCEGITDCDGDTICDFRELEDCGPLRLDCRDCNANGIPDGCELDDCPPGDLACQDCNGDGVPNECEPDCDGDGIPDRCEIDACPPGDPTCADCDRDGIPDGCQIDACPPGDSLCEDCNGDGVMNTCEMFAFQDFESPARSFSGTNTVTHVFQQLPAADSVVRLWLETNAGVGRTSVALRINGFDYGRPFEGRQSCVRNYVLVELSASEFNQLASDGRLEVAADPSNALGNCDLPYLKFTLHIPTRVTQVGDCNENLTPDTCDLLDGTSVDLGANGIPDECEPDCNNNRLPDSYDLLTGASTDCDGNNVPDDCQADCDGDGAIDICALSDCPPGDPACADCNQNGIPDACDIADCAADDILCQDCNGDGRPDQCNFEPGPVQATSPEFQLLNLDNPFLHTFSGLPHALETVQIEVTANGPYVPMRRYVEVALGGEVVGRLFETWGASCVPETGILQVPANAFNRALAGGQLQLEVTSTSELLTCRFVQVTLNYVGAVGGDCDRNGVLDACDIAAGRLADVNNDGVPDACDCDENGVEDQAQLDAGASDCNEDGLLDACIASCDCSADLDGDQLVDLNDLATVLMHFGSTGMAGDTNDDNRTGLRDLATVLASFGCCCE